MKRFFWLINFLILLNGVAYSQESEEEEGVMGLADRVVDFFSGEIPLRGNEHPIQWVVAPVVAYAPETSWQFGVGGKVLFESRRALESTRTSFVSFAVRYTLNNQLFASPEYTIFSYNENYIQRGEVAYIQFPRLYYGIGNNTPVENEELFSSTLFSIEHLTYRNVWDKLYAGLGFRYALTYNLETLADGLLEADNPVGVRDNQAVGWDVGLMFDNRDNVLSTTSGFLAEFRQRFHQKALGSDFNYRVGVLNVRNYLKPFKNRRDIIASQVYGYFAFGDIPFTELAPLGGDMIMRGYYEGRYLEQPAGGHADGVPDPHLEGVGSSWFCGSGRRGQRLSGVQYSEPKAFGWGRFALHADSRRKSKHPDRRRLLEGAPTTSTSIFRKRFSYEHPRPQTPHRRKCPAAL